MKYLKGRDDALMKRNTFVGSADGTPNRERDV